MVRMPVRSATIAASPIWSVLATRRSQILNRRALVENGLAMQADQLHLMPAGCFENRVGIEFTQ